MGDGLFEDLDFPAVAASLGEVKLAGLAEDGISWRRAPSLRGVTGDAQLFADIGADNIAQGARLVGSTVDAPRKHPSSRF